MRRVIFATVLLVFCAAGCTTGRQIAMTPACDGVGPEEVSKGAPMRSVLQLSPFADGTYWYLRDGMQWSTTDPKTQKTFAVTTPKGFVTDLASIPRPLWIILPKWDGYGVGAVIHDYLYWSQHVSRRDADRWFYGAMTDQHVSWLHKRLIYGAVRLFGGMAWNGNARRRMGQHIQCLTASQFPDDPTKTWDQVRDAIEHSPAFVLPPVPKAPPVQSTIYPGGAP